MAGENRRERTMGLRGEFLAEVQEYVAELTKDAEAVILDAATGAGETTLQIAEAMKGGQLFSVDCDYASWSDWAQPLLDKGGLLERVEFIQADLGAIPLEAESVDLIVSHATLSAVGIYAVDAVAHFYHLLKPGGRLALTDLIPEDETEQDENNIAAMSWRVMKAAGHLAGEHHYEEFPTDWIRRRLKNVGFEIRSFEVDRSRGLASQVSYEEWQSTDWADNIDNEVLSKAIREVQAQLVGRAEREGLTAKTGSYSCWAGKE